MNTVFSLNGRKIDISVDPGEALSLVLRNRLGIKSILNDCRMGFCGKCVVLIDNVAMPSCLVPAFKIRNRSIITYEGLLNTPEHKTISREFMKAGIELCGFCDAAIYMALASLLYKIRGKTGREDTVFGGAFSTGRKTHDIGEREVMETMSSVYCRCNTPGLIIDAAKNAIREYGYSGRRHERNP